MKLSGDSLTRELFEKDPAGFLEKTIRETLIASCKWKHTRFQGQQFINELSRLKPGMRAGRKYERSKKASVCGLLTGGG